jgi:hypothetical protein
MSVKQRFAPTGVLAVLGAAITIATWIGGEPYLAIILAAFYVVSCVVSCLWSRGSGDFAAIMGLSGDERQKMMDTRATAIAGLAALGFCVAGAIVDRARRLRQPVGGDLRGRRDLARGRPRRVATPGMTDQRRASSERSSGLGIGVCAQNPWNKR